MLGIVDVFAMDFAVAEVGDERGDHAVALRVVVGVEVLLDAHEAGRDFEKHVRVDLGSEAHEIQDPRTSLGFNFEIVGEPNDEVGSVHDRLVSERTDHCVTVLVSAADIFIQVIDHAGRHRCEDFVSIAARRDDLGTQDALHGLTQARKQRLGFEEALAMNTELDEVPNVDVLRGVEHL